MIIEIVDLPINSMVIFHSYVSLPEGNFIHWLVVWNMTVIFPFHIWDVTLPIDELIFFKMVEPTNQFRS